MSDQDPLNIDIEQLLRETAKAAADYDAAEFDESGQQDLHARPAVLCRRARDRAALLYRRDIGLAFRRPGERGGR